MQTVKQLGDRLAQAGHPLKPRTIQTALGELEAAGLAAGSEKGNGRARYWSPATPIRMPTAPMTVNRAMVGRGHGMTRLATSWIEASPNPPMEPPHVVLVRLVVTDLRTAPSKERPHQRSAAPREPGGLAGMLDGWSRCRDALLGAVAGVAVGSSEHC
jgi:hypothetical protein